MNSAKSNTTVQTISYLQFDRELRTTNHLMNDFKAFVENDIFVVKITPYLKRLANVLHVTSVFHIWWKSMN